MMSRNSCPFALSHPLQNLFISAELDLLFPIGLLISTVCFTAHMESPSPVLESLCLVFFAVFYFVGRQCDEQSNFLTARLASPRFKNSVQSEPQRSLIQLAHAVGYDCLGLVYLLFVSLSQLSLSVLCNSFHLLLRSLFTVYAKSTILATVSVMSF